MALPNRVVKGMTPALQYLIDMMSFFKTEAIRVPNDFRKQVLETKELLKDDPSGLCNTLADLSIRSALVDYRIETDNDNLTEFLNRWIDSVNIELLGTVPTGLEALAKEYFRERWKGSSFLVLRTLWEDQENVRVPTSLFFVDGEDVVINTPNDGAVNLGDEKYAIRLQSGSKQAGKNKENQIPLPTSEDEKVFVQKPFESWSTRYPVPFLIRRGIFHNSKFLQLLTSKGEFIVSKALEYLLVLKKGTEGLAKDLQITYSREDLEKVNEELKKLIDDKKTSEGFPSYTTNFDTDITEYIPDYGKAISNNLYAPLEKRILAGWGVIEVVDSVTVGSRRESVLNPRPFVAEIEQGVEDFKSLLNDLIKTIIIQNKQKHPKWMNAKIRIVNSPVKGFMTDNMRTLLRSLYDRGALSKRTFIEVVGDLDYDVEVQRRKVEKSTKVDETLYPPVIQNLEQYADGQQPKQQDLQKKENTPPDKTGPEAKNFTQSTEDLEAGGLLYEEAPYKTNKDLPAQLADLPAGAKTLWRKTFNAVFESTKDEDKARKIAWTNVKIKYKKVEDEWVRKTNSEIASSLDEFTDLPMQDLVDLKKLQLMGKQADLIDKLIQSGKSDETV